MNITSDQGIILKKLVFLQFVWGPLREVRTGPGSTNRPVPGLLAPNNGLNQRSENKFVHNQKYVI